MRSLWKRFLFWPSNAHSLLALNASITPFRYLFLIAPLVQVIYLFTNNMSKSHKRIPYVLCPLILSLAMAFPVHSEDNPHVFWEGSPSYPAGSTQSWTISESQSTRKLLLLAKPTFNTVLKLENPLTLSFPVTSGSEFPFALDITSYNDSVNPAQPALTTLITGKDLTIHQTFTNNNDAHTINVFLGKLCIEANWRAYSH